ncbi:MAG: ATP-binding protein, partial [Nitrospirota bacterium]|nr:ATP-binding protein [Nitrospirota bacterium]
EIRSAGGDETSKGYKVTHFELDYDGIITKKGKKDKDYHPKPLADDEEWDPKPCTMIILKNFLPKKVPDKETFSRQLSYRFAVGTKDFSILIRDNKENPEPAFPISEVPIPLMEGTRIDVCKDPVIIDEEKKLSVTGWVGMAKASYKNEEFAGIRIYVRGKVASITRDFGLPAGFTGEFTARSYLVGEIHADWLDDDEDLIQTHRQDILWSSELGQVFSRWGREIIKRVAKAGREPRRVQVCEQFLVKSDLKKIAHNRYNDPELEKTVLDLGEKIGKFASEDELEDDDYIDGLREIILTVAPHKLLIDTFKKIQYMADKDGKVDLKELIKLFQTSKIAQLASYGQIVSEKIKVIDIFKKSIRDDKVEEKQLQSLLENAPWLIDPKWEPITANQQFKSFRDAFHAWFKKKYKKEIITSISLCHPDKRPDFIFLHIENSIKLVEIKPPKHAFNDEDWKRLNCYDDAMEEFLKANKSYRDAFPRSFNIILIADSIKLKDTSNKKAFESLESKGRLIPKTWEDLLNDTTQFHKSFLDARDSLEGVKS